MPYFYAEGVTHLESSNAEGFSNSISPKLERRDIDALQHRIISPQFSLTMKNEAYETHMINEIYVDAIAIEDNESAYNTTDGAYYVCESTYSPTRAAVDQKNIRSQILKKDENEYYSRSDSFDLAAKEEIYLEFDKLPEGEFGLITNFRQTFVTTFLLYSGIAYMGDEVGDYFTKIETDKLIRNRLKHPFDKLGKIEISVWNEDKNRWLKTNELYETGPIAKNLVFAPLKNLKPKNGKIKLRIKLAKGLWRLDYLALGKIKSKVDPISRHPHKMNSISGWDDPISKIHSDDDNYKVSFPGDEYKMDFSFPPLKAGSSYELFLSSKGYYLEWVRKEWLLEKDIPKLRNMITNDAETWRNLAIEFKSMEEGMEEVFWNSKYSSIQ